MFVASKPVKDPSWIQQSQYRGGQFKEPAKGLDSGRVNIEVTRGCLEVHVLVLDPLEDDDHDEHQGGDQRPHGSPVELQWTRHVEHFLDIGQEPIATIHPGHHDHLGVFGVKF